MGKDIFLVGIGASAGGLKPLQSLVSSLPAKSDMAYIIAQHLDPPGKSPLRDLLSKNTSLTVRQAEDNERLKQNTIYVAPPNAFLKVDGDQIRLTPPRPEPEPETEPGPGPGHAMRWAVDQLFRSIANRAATNCAGVILSGSGSDGAAGIRVIKAAGGLTLVQPADEAEHPGMPQSAIETGVVDKVLPVNEMAAILEYYSTHRIEHIADAGEAHDQDEDISDPGGPLLDTGDLQESLHDLTALLETHENFDLRQYKPTTVQRRVARRMSMTAITNYQDYIDHLRQDAGEREQLSRDLLINVTDFFRDRKAFTYLEEQAIRHIFETASKGEEIRVWVAGCATGEEAYTMAILLLENAEKYQKENPISVFATDIDEDAIATARSGRYTASIAGEVPKLYLDRYFSKLDNDHYQIHQRARDVISFAKQNVVSDPPFSRMNLISCRNLLIYLRKEVQETVMQSFYFALRDRGFLFLGTSETVGRQVDLFKPVSKKWRLYGKVEGRKGHVQPYSKYIPGNFKPIRKREKMKDPASPIEKIGTSILNTFQPPTLVVSEEGHVLYKFKDLSPFLVIPSGEPRNDFIAMVPSELRPKYKSALFRARKHQEKVSFLSPVNARTNDGEVKRYRVTLAPLETADEGSEGAIAISFEYESDVPLDPPPNQAADESNFIQKLELELAETREELQTTIEELDANAEELKAAHEETLSTNEELQSTNEELEASAEELRSLNEELSTVNSQLKEKVDELQRANDDVENFVASTDLATIFLDADLKIQRYTPAAERLLNMGPRDIARPITALGRDLIDKDLPDDAKTVLNEFATLRREVRNYDGEWFIRHMTPYRTEDRRIEGVVISFQDVNEIKQLSKRAEMRERQQSVIAQLGLVALHEDNLDELMRQTVRQVAEVLDVEYCKILKYQPEEKNLKMLAGVGWSPGLVGVAVVPSEMDSQGGYTLGVKEPVIVNDLSRETRFAGPALLIDHHVVAGMSCVINHSDPPYGVLGVHTREYREFTEDDAHFLVAIANLLSYAVKNAAFQHELQISETRLQLAREAADLGIHDWDTTTDKIRWDDRIYEIWGVDPSTDITYDIFINGVHSSDRERVHEEAQASLQEENGGFFQSEYRVINQKSKRLYWVHANGNVTFKNGEAVRLVGTVADITAIKDSERIAEESKDKLEAALSAANLGTWRLDPESNYITRHPNLSRLLGFTAKETTEPLEEFVNRLHEDDQKTYLENITASLKEDGVHELELRVACPEGGHIWVKDKGRVIEKDGQRFVTGAMVDISRIKEIEQEAIKANHHKSEFLAMMSHEIRTPLNAVVGITNILRDMPDLPAEKVKDLYATLATSAEALLALINDILDISKIDSGVLHLEKNAFALDELMQNVTNLTLSKIKSPAVNLKLESSAIADKKFIGDENRIRQILLNLTTNAAKFTSEGEIEFKAQLDRQGAIILTVKDTGIGIPEESQQLIFDRFTQTDVGSAREYEGTGLGLAIVKSLVDAMGGTVSLKSELGQGSTFTVTLPLEQATKDESAPQELVTPQQEPDQIGGNILLVEDKDANILVAKMMVESQGYAVETRNNGQAAIDAITSNHEKYCGILLDIRMPGLDGYEVMGRIRAMEQQKNLSRIPIIAITANALVDDEQKCLYAGADAYLPKPFDPEILYQTLNAYCSPADDTR